MHIYIITIKQIRIKIQVGCEYTMYRYDVIALVFKLALLTVTIHIRLRQAAHF